MERTVAEFRRRLKERREDLEKIRKLLAALPDGNLIVMHAGGRARFYTGPCTGRRYLGKDKERLISDLAHRDYYEKLEKALSGEVKALTSFLDRFRPDECSMVYRRLSDDRKNLVIPFYETEEQAVASWKAAQEVNLELGRNSFGIPGDIRTKNGEHVRSKSEKIIADALLDRGIPYYYELPLRIRNKILYPDFTILNVRTGKTWYWEHLGLTDSPEYMERVALKLELYRQEAIWPGDGLIQTYESSKYPLNTDVIEASIEKYLL